MLIETKLAILNSGFLLVTEVAKLAGFSSTNRSLQPNKWKRNHKILAIQQGERDYWYLYGPDPGDFCLRKQMAEVLKAFSNAKDSWGLTF